MTEENRPRRRARRRARTFEPFHGTTDDEDDDEDGHDLSPMTRILGVGNPLMGDDGVGIAVVEQLWGESLPPGVEVVDAGTGGLDLVHLIGESDAALLVDAVEMGAEPGTLRWFRPQTVQRGGELCHLSLHETRLGAVLQWLELLGCQTPVWILGVQPASVRLGEGLSLPVQRAVPQAVRLVREFVGAGVSASQ